MIINHNVKLGWF